ncbi:hypothetical protein HNP65_001169 [Thermosipho japonicus]|uniref:Uncharacterized protein n=1 Tax=Thermosipho japonicus TaxID=90323 RepID=A0A841GK20_9BACT|nr:hypothetical protein [Thermosipho japonicus]MBB6062717.1 hypothetical protein [Thermosipho japonicus]
MKKRLFLLLAGLLVIFIVFSGCLQQLPNNNDGDENSGGTNLGFDGIIASKLDYLFNETSDATVTGVLVYKYIGSTYGYGIIADATAGLYIKDISSANLNVGDKVTVRGALYKDTYHGNLRMKNVTVVSTATEVMPEPVVLNVGLKNGWLFNDAGETTDATSLALWNYRFVTAKGTLTSLDNDGKKFELEYPVESGSATVTVYTYTAIATCTDKPATITGYLAAYYGEWRLYPRDLDDIEF